MDAATKFAVLAVLILGAVIACAKPLGKYIADVMEGRDTFASRIGRPLERLIYRLCGTDPSREMTWSHYAIALLAFNVLGALIVYVLQRLQPWLPLNPQHLAAVSPDSSFNTAVSFVTKAMAVLKEESALTAARCCGFSGSHGWSRWRP